MALITGNGKWYRASLRLMGDGLPAGDIEGMLGIKPSSLGIKGKHINDDPRKATYSTNIWTLRSGTSSDVPFDEQITLLLDLIEPNLGVIEKLLADPTNEGELFLGFGSDNGQGGGFLPQQLLRRIAEFGLSIDLDLYPPGDEDD